MSTTQLSRHTYLDVLVEIADSEVYATLTQLDRSIRQLGQPHVGRMAGALLCLRELETGLYEAAGLSR